MGITNMAATIPGFLVPAVVGALTHGKVNLHSFILKSLNVYNQHIVINFLNLQIKIFYQYRMEFLHGTLRSI